MLRSFLFIILGVIILSFVYVKYAANMDITTVSRDLSAQVSVPSFTDIITTKISELIKQSIEKAFSS